MSQNKTPADPQDEYNKWHTGNSITGSENRGMAWVKPTVIVLAAAAIGSFLFWPYLKPYIQNNSQPVPKPPVAGNARAQGFIPN